LLEKGIGPDLISDMTQRIIDEEICQFTLDVMEKFEIKGTFDYKAKSGNHYLLDFIPQNFKPLPSSGLGLFLDTTNWLLLQNKILAEEF
jgi:hypothetical protein